MRRTLYFAPTAITALRMIDRRLVRQVWSVIEALRDDPDALTYRTDSFDPSIYGVTAPGDVTIWFEIVDEQHAIRILDIEE